MATGHLLAVVSHRYGFPVLKELKNIERIVELVLSTPDTYPSHSENDGNSQLSMVLHQTAKT